MVKHFVKIFYGNFMDDLQQEVNAFTSKSDFGSLAKIQDIQIVQKGEHSMAIMVHYTAYREVQ